MGFLEIAANRGSAAKLVEAAKGTDVSIFSATASVTAGQQ
jgi:hypothetical protein